VNALFLAVILFAIAQKKRTANIKLTQVGGNILRKLWVHRIAHLRLLLPLS